MFKFVRDTILVFIDPREFSGVWRFVSDILEAFAASNIGIVQDDYAVFGLRWS